MGRPGEPVGGSRRPPLPEPPWDELDPGIRPLVRALFAAGWRTFESCQGGDGHAFPAPTVIVRPRRNPSLARSLIDLGVTGFSIGRWSDYQNRPVPWNRGPYSKGRLELRLWSLDCLPPSLGTEGG